MSHRRTAADYPVEIHGCLEAFDRCNTLLDRLAHGSQDTTRDAYVAIGPHMRHCLDHVTCLLDGLDSGIVDYDARERSELLERDPDRFRNALESATARLKSLDPQTLHRSLEVRQAAGPGGRSVGVTSSLSRELVFLSGHTIHHLAIMALLAEKRGIRISEQLTVAFSTAAYRTETGVERR